MKASMLPSSNLPQPAKTVQIEVSQADAGLVPRACTPRATASKSSSGEADQASAGLGKQGKANVGCAVFEANHYRNTVAVENETSPKNKRLWHETWYYLLLCCHTQL